MWVVGLGFIIVLMCVRSCTLEMNQSLSVCVCVRMCLREKGRKRKKHSGCECRHVCVSLCMHLPYCIWISWLRMRVFSLIRQIGVDATRGERRGLGRRSEARLMPVCINAVWHLSARDAHTHCDALRYGYTVCV